MAKQNCWEFKKCGRQIGGEKVKELGVCPAANNTATNQINQKEIKRSFFCISFNYCNYYII